MKSGTRGILLTIALGLGAVDMATVPAAARPPVTTTFTFQGLVTIDGAGADGPCDFQFALYDALIGGLPIGPTLVFDGVGGNPGPIQVIGGILSVELDFGDVFGGEQRFLEVSVRCPSGVGSYTVLPRVALNATPYAQFALDAPPDFTLPLAVTINDPQVALDLTNDGGGVYSAVTSHDGASALTALHTGDGSAGFFEGNDALSSANVVEVRSMTGGVALKCLSSGVGGVAEFESSDPLSAADAVSIAANGSGDALSCLSTGNGRAGHFEVSNAAGAATEAIKAVTSSGGRAGLFEISAGAPQNNTRPAVEGVTNANGPGVMGSSLHGNGVFGTTDSAGSFNEALGGSPAGIIAGVHGKGSANAATADNFGVAGTSDSYGSGILGIGELGGHGVIGVSGTQENNQSNAGVWGMTREGVDGAATWPPHFPIDGGGAGKMKVGVLGQAYDRVGVWGESINKIGVVATAGDQFDVGAFPSGTGPIGLFCAVRHDEGIGGYFDTPEATNFMPALFARTAGLGPAAEFKATLATGTPDFALKVTSDGVGGVAQFLASSATNPRDVVSASTNGTGSAGFFQVGNPASPAPALAVTTSGTGRAGEFVVNNPAHNSDVLAALATNSHHALFAQQSGPGEAAHFEIADPGNFNNAVFIKNNGGGIALSVENNNPSFAALALASRGKSAFNGQVDIIGNLVVDGPASIDGLLCATSVCAAVKNFRIDHPLDPERKYLQHASVESDQLKTFYDGTVTLDARGEADVDLPRWFEALSGDFRYQLTCVGGYAPVYIASEISDGRFRIAGGYPGLKVCWQISGIRRDPYAIENPMEVELDKPISASVEECAQ
ncbi:MAG: hypothetical protein AB1752_06965 [Candidatus Zixiibacteriota bacterium]